VASTLDEEHFIYLLMLYEAEKSASKVCGQPVPTARKYNIIRLAGLITFQHYVHVQVILYADGPPALSWRPKLKL